MAGAGASKGSTMSDRDRYERDERSDREGGRKRVSLLVRNVPDRARCVVGKRDGDRPRRGGHRVIG